MSVQIVIELPDARGVQSVIQAVETYKERLRASIEQTRRAIQTFEKRYGVTTSHFLNEMTAEDLADQDAEYVEWAGEAKLLQGLESELDELEHVQFQLP